MILCLVLGCESLIIVHPGKSGFQLGALHRELPCIRLAGRVVLTRLVIIDIEGVIMLLLGRCLVSIVGIFMVQSGLHHVWWGSCLT